MKCYNNLNDFVSTQNGIVTLGTFDGVHRGHQVLMDRIKSIAAETGGGTVLFTFHPHPRKVLFPSMELKILTTPDEKVELIAQKGIDHLIIHPFTKEFSRKTALSFVRDILVNRMKIKKLIIGHDHHFGRNREGSYENLKEYARLYRFDLEQLSPEKVKNQEVSSSKIREALLKGQIPLANEFLNYHYFFSGKVAQGAGLGKELGFPTANIVPADEEKLIPANGVYAVGIKTETGYFKGMMNIGFRPTFDSNKAAKANPYIEVHIFDFNGDIYGKAITVYFYEKIREEKKFSGKEELQKQLLHDKENVMKIFSSIPKLPKINA